MSSNIEKVPTTPLVFPLDRVSQPTKLPDGVVPQDNPTPFPINFDTAPLWQLVDDLYVGETHVHPRRLRQIMDVPTVDYFMEKEQPEFVSAQALWKELGGKGSFVQPTWKQHAQYFGTKEMYTDPLHKDTIHGEMHQDKGRVLALAEILGQYKKLSNSDMKVLLVAAATHDMGRENDMENPNHGLVAAKNVDGTNEDDPTKNYLAIYKARGIEFTLEEVTLWKILCEYHEKPWEEVPEEYKKDKRISTLLQTLQAADALDRFRSPHIRWQPQPKFFMRFFDNDTNKIAAAFRFAKYFALQSEKHRLENNLSAEEAMRDMLNHIGFLHEKPNQPFGWSTLLRRTPFGGLY